MKQLISLVLSIFLFVGMESPLSGTNDFPMDHSNPTELLKLVVDRPIISYKGRITITQWFGKKSRSEEADVFYAHPNQYRWNYLSPSGNISRIVISDGTSQLVYIPDEKALMGKAARTKSKAMDQKQEWNLLCSNYKVSILKEDEVIGRPTWLLELKPLFTGKPRQHLMVDQETYVVLENRRFQPKGGKIAALTRFTSFEPQDELPFDLFRLETEDQGMAVAVHELDLDFLDYEDAVEPLEADIPQALPNGFVFESGDTLDIQGKSVGHYRYTDGLAVLSLFVSELPVDMDPQSEASIVVSPSSTGTILLSTSGRVLSKKGRDRYYTLVGDISKKILKMASSQLH